MFKKFRKRHSKKLLAFLTAVLLVGCCGCGAGTQTETQSGTQADETLPAATESLVLYAGPYVAKYLNQAVTLFKQQYPDVDVQVRDFGDANDYQNEENYMEVLKSDLAAGEGPDLILFTPGELGDLDKIAEGGTFQDLDGYFQNDSEFSLDTCNEAVMDSGIYQGSRLFVPISYSVNLLLTCEETLEAENQTLPETQEDLYAQMTAYGETYRDDTSKYFTQQYDLFYNLFQASALSVVDYSDKTVTVDNDGFQSFMNAYAALYEMDHQRSEDGVYVTDPDNSETGDFVKLNREDKILYIHETAPFDFLDDYGELLYDHTPVYTAIPSESGKPAVQVAMTAAINKNSDNKENAYQLLKILLSEEMQSYGMNSGCGFFSYPVLSGVLEKCLTEENITYAGVSTPDKTIVYASVPADTITAFVDAVSDVTCSNISYTVEKFVWDEMEPYFKGQKSYDDCLSSLKNKLELYVNE